jgi:flagellar motor protein MotB
MKYKGYGLTQPVSSNETPEGRALNRRTEFMIIKK